MGTRPRLACEVRSEGVVAARAEDAAAVLSAVAKAPLAAGIEVPHVRIGGMGISKEHRSALVAAIKSALERVSQRGREVTLVVPDAAVRVLLLDFDVLPAKPAEALPIVRFRLKKLLPFDADHAAVSYQVMASRRDLTKVVAVAMPNELREDYEAVVREAGFEPGALLPSTLAAIAGLSESDRPILLVNAAHDSVTTAIVRSGVILLHRTVDLAGAANVSTEESPVQPRSTQVPSDTSIAAIAARLASAGTHAGAVVSSAIADAGSISVPVRVEPAVIAPPLRADANDDVAQAVSVAVAYFEDTLETAPPVVMAAGTFGVGPLTSILDEASVGPVAVQEVVDQQMIGVGGTSDESGKGLPLGWLAGVRGALAN